MVIYSLDLESFSSRPNRCIGLLPSGSYCYDQVMSRPNDAIQALSIKLDCVHDSAGKDAPKLDGVMETVYRLPARARDALGLARQFAAHPCQF